ncbi:MAG: hypothetical protein V7L23_15205 [Nostoc sp.]|uniref:hypothetical protein n=1 Tax=Nostoc sp. TaxID=1180 RepID=UPI002FEF729A
MPAKSTTPEENPQATVENPTPTPTASTVPDPATVSAPIEVEKKVHGIYATEYFKKNKIPYCQECGAQNQHGLFDEPVCAEGLTREQGCPRV